MRKITYIALLLMLLCSQWALASEGATDNGEIASQAKGCPELQPLDEVLLAGRGCCSHHKGQCGCEGGRVVCCDGSMSPSCRCEVDTPIKMEN